MTHRYKLDEKLVPHPWRQRRHPISGALEPSHTWHRGIQDSERNEWAVEPQPKTVAQFAEVRRLNGMPPLTPQKVRGVLKKAGIRFSESHATRVHGWHSVSSGVTVWQDMTGAISIGYTFNHWAKERPYQTMLAPARKALEDSGLPFTQHDDGRIEL